MLKAFFCSTPKREELAGETKWVQLKSNRITQIGLNTKLIMFSDVNLGAFRDVASGNFLYCLDNGLSFATIVCIGNVEVTGEYQPKDHQTNMPTDVIQFCNENCSVAKVVVPLRKENQEHVKSTNNI